MVFSNGRVELVADDLTLEGVPEYDGKEMLAFPGLVDAHMHTEIYSHLSQDAITKSKAGCRTCQSESAH